MPESEGGGGGRLGIMNKIKRYSAASNKLIMRRNNANLIRKHSPHRSSSGSYDMTGDSSKDLRTEDGVPILITTNTIDMDKVDSGLKLSPRSCLPLSSDSDTDIFADAASSIQNFGDIKFSFFPPTSDEIGHTYGNVSSSTEEGDYEVPPSPRSIHNYSFDSEQMRNYAETLDSPPTIQAPLRKNKSKSASSLQHSEVVMSLTRKFATQDKTDNEDTSSDKENSSDWGNKNQCSNTTINSVLINQLQTPEECLIAKPQVADKVMQNSVSVDNMRKSSESVNSPTKPLVFDPCNERNYLSEESLNSINSRSSLSDDFDLKSASFESLQEARNLVLSIEELNELTRQINESEDFSQKIDLEYCEHRNNLKPTERRVTLLRNKHHRINLHLDEKKEKITNAWTGIKSWLGEEKGKIKEVVHRHAALQRVGALTQRPFKKKGSEARSSVERSESMTSSASQLELSDIETDSETTKQSCSRAETKNVRSNSNRPSEERELPTVLSAFMRKPKPDTTITEVILR